jgi:hypothetical protein
MFCEERSRSVENVAISCFIVNLDSCGGFDTADEQRLINHLKM